MEVTFPFVVVFMDRPMVYIVSAWCTAVHKIYWYFVKVLLFRRGGGLISERDLCYVVETIFSLN